MLLVAVKKFTFVDTRQGTEGEDVSNLLSFRISAARV